MSSLHTPVTARDHSRGGDDASATLVEYGDYECPACGEAQEMVDQILEHFGDNLRFVFRNFPLQESHPHAEMAAEAAEFAAANGKFWEMHDLLYANQDRLDIGGLSAMAERLGLDASALETSLNTREFESRVRSDFVSGVRSGVNGTPTFFINGERYDGPYDTRTIAEEIYSQGATPADGSSSYPPGVERGGPGFSYHPYY
jgi:protein-disulfide isomerase